MSYRMGLDCILAVDSAGVGQGSWATVTDAEDVTLSLERPEDEVANRSLTWAGVLAGLIRGSVEVELTCDPADTQWQALRTAFFTRANIGVALYDGAIATVGSSGLQMDCQVTSWSQSETLEGAVKTSMTLKPSATTTTAPAWATTSA